MDDLPHLDYLDGRPSPLGLPGWTPFPTWITWTDTWNTWMDDLHCLQYLDGEASLLALLGWTTFTA
eukprot:5708461-Karenia_brevis.AAC.1